MCAYRFVMRREALSFTVLALVACLSPLAGCAVETDDAEGGEGEENLTSDQVDAKRIEAIRKVVVQDVEVSKVSFSKRAKAPVKSAGSGYRSEAGPSLYGVDWFQKWPGGVNADHGWENGTEYGKRCMWAANLRFEAIMKDPPAELRAFLAEYTRWGGSFYNWVDDYSKPEASGDASQASLWAWRTGLTKWISAAAKDGSCYLPTRKMVVDYVKTCNDHQKTNDGEMQGCRR